LLNVTDLNTSHGWNHVLRGVTFQVRTGSIISIVGANGAGKSTLLGTIAGIYNCSRGEINLDGKPIQNLPPEKVVRQGICLVPEGRHIFGSLTVEDNLLLGAYHRWRGEQQKIKEEINEILEIFPALIPRRHDLAGGLSGGMQQMLAIGRGLMTRPRVMLLDEPSLGLAPLIVKEIFMIINSLKKMGTTFLLVEQNARAAMQVADWVYVMAQGKIVLDGEPEELKMDQRIQQAYLGRGYNHLA